MISSTMTNKVLKLVRITASALIILAIWEIGALIVNDSYFLPGFLETFSALIVLLSQNMLFMPVLVSLARVLLGLVLGIIAGVLLATASYFLPLANDLISTLISIMKATPIATIILILWYALSDASLAIFVVILIVTPVVWQNVYDGYKSISLEMLEICEAYEASAAKKMKILYLPAATKFLIPSIITSIGLAWKAEIAAEIMTYSNIGRSIQDFKTTSYDTASVFAWALVIVVMSILLEYLTKFVLTRIKH